MIKYSCNLEDYGCEIDEGEKTWGYIEVDVEGCGVEIVSHNYEPDDVENHGCCDEKHAHFDVVLIEDC